MRQHVLFDLGLYPLVSRMQDIDILPQQTRIEQSKEKVEGIQAGLWHTWIQQVQSLQGNIPPCIEGSLQLIGTLHDEELRSKIAFEWFDNGITSYPPVVKEIL